MIIDFRTIANQTAAECDVAIVGSGPAGLGIAAELAGSGVRVIVLETGGEQHDQQCESLSEFEWTGCRRVHPLAVRRRLFGGTSVVWTGRCVPLSATDFQFRRWVPNSGWPIDASDLDGYWDRAGHLLGIGPVVNDDRIWTILGVAPEQPGWDRRALATEVFQSSIRDHQRFRTVPPAAPDATSHIGALQHSGAPSAVDVAESLRNTLERSPNVHIWQNAHVLRVLANPEGTVATGVAIHRPGNTALELRAGMTVLAGGGIDNARLLLLSGSASHNGLGNSHDRVGRYLSDHHYCPLGHFEGAASNDLRRRLSYRWLGRDRRHQYLTGLALSPTCQMERQLLRAAIFPFEHFRGVAAITGAARGMRRMLADHDPGGVRDLIGALAQPVQLTRDIVDRYARLRPPLAPLRRLDIGCNVEQIADPESRVTLGDELDSVGQRRARIDWRVHEQEFQTYQATAEIFKGECERLGISGFTTNPQLSMSFGEWRSTVHDMAHPMCATRMSADPRHGVVDSNCKVHGVDNLYIAGSSTFATGGTANPTLTLVALAIRLADHLANAVAAPARITTGEVHASGTVAHPVEGGGSLPPMRRPIRLGVLGAGERVRTIHGPVLRALSRQFEVVAVAGRTAERTRRTAEELGWRPCGDLAELLAQHAVEAVLVAVGDQANGQSLARLAPARLPILAETPLAWTRRERQRILASIRRYGALVSIAEQFPFLPIEQFRAKLIRLGTIGATCAAVNHMDVYDYHGIARSRALLGYGRVPKRAVGSWLRFIGSCRGIGHAVDRPVAAQQEIWLRGHVEHLDQTAIVQDYSPGYATLPTRPPGRFLLTGTRGAIDNTSLLVTDARTGCARTIDIEYRRSAGRSDSAPDSIAAQTDEHGTIVWNNPFAGQSFSDEQVAVATVLSRWGDAIRHGGVGPYTAAEAAVDMEYLRAIHTSAQRGGAGITMPLWGRTSDFLSKLHTLLRRRRGSP